MASATQCFTFPIMDHIFLVAQSIMCTLILRKSVYSSLQTYPHPSDEGASIPHDAYNQSHRASPHHVEYQVLSFFCIFALAVFSVLNAFSHKETLSHPSTSTLNPVFSWKPSWKSPGRAARSYLYMFIEPQLEHIVACKIAHLFVLSLTRLGALEGQGPSVIHLIKLVPGIKTGSKIKSLPL